MTINTKLIALILATSVFLCSCSKKQSQSTPQNQPQAQNQTQMPQKTVSIPVFDGMKAFDDLLAQTNLGPRTVGSKAHELCLQYLQTELKNAADTVWLQPFSDMGYNQEILQMTNVIASFNKSSTKRILFLTHWDSRPWADQDKDPKKRNQPILGANDGASGVAVFLEMTRIFKSSPPPIGVDFLFVDGEDYGKEGDESYYLLGSRYFAQHLPPKYTPEFGILLDMIGDSDLEIKKERISLQYAPDIVDLVWSTAEGLGVYQFSNAIETNLGADDHIPLNQAGIKTIDLIDFSYPNSTTNYWHTSQDTPDHCSSASLEAVGKVLVQVIFTQTP